MNIGIVTLLLFGCMMVLLLTGLPLAFVLGGTAVLFTATLWSMKALFNIPSMAIEISRTLVWVAIPLFILMGCILERCGIAEGLYAMLYGTLGRLKGGLAVATVIICTIFAAMSGVSGAATTTMGIVALPSMLKRGYDKHIAIGCIAAGGALGILIPPSCTMIVYGLFGRESVGRLFAGGVFPGLLLSTLFIIYVLIRSYLKPNLGPAIPKEEAYSATLALKELKALILPILLIIAVLGSIFTGIATPTEAAAVGAMGAIVCASVNRRMTWKLFAQALDTTYSITGMLIWIALGALVFSAVYVALGAPDLIKEILATWNVNRWWIVIFMQLMLLILGCFMDATAIIMITVPLFVPIITSLGFDTVWFGILFTMNMEMAFLTPPFGVNLFYLRAVVPREINMADIYKSVTYFVCIQALGLAIVMVFPQIALWLPNLMFGKAS